MPAAVRVGDNSHGHPLPPDIILWPPRPATKGSPNVFVNGSPAVRVAPESDGKDWAKHCAPGPV
jgi:hypothetical protein